MDYKISNEYDGNLRKLFRGECKFCNKEFWRPKHKLKKSSYCSKECYKICRQKIGKSVDVTCIFCKKSFKRWQHLLAKVSSKKYYCSRACQAEDRIKTNSNCQFCLKKIIKRKKILLSRM